MTRPPRPLSAWVYLRRNPRRVLPILAIQALVTALLVAIITPTNAFRATSETYLRALDYLTTVTPARRKDFDHELLARLDENEAMLKRLPAKTFMMHTPMIVGRGVAPLLAIEKPHQEELVARVGMRLVRGRLPAARTPEAAIHESVLRARGMDIGDEFGRFVDPNDDTPGKFEVVGVLSGDVRLGLVDFEWCNTPFSVQARTDAYQIVYAKKGQKAASDDFLRSIEDESGNALLRVYDARLARSKLDEHLENLGLIIGFITIAVAVVVALVTALLSVIAFQSRLEEFGLLLALGHRRRTLVRKLFVETSVVAVVGWIAGLALGLGLLVLYRDGVLAPKAIDMHVVDPLPIALSLSVPVLSMCISALALFHRLRRMDAVAVLQRRGA